MDATVLALVFTGLFLLLLLGGMWIPLGLGFAGVLLLFLDGRTGSYQSLGLVTWGSLNSFTLTAIPLYILMGEVILQSGISRSFYHGLSHWVRRVPGGLLQTNIVGSASFAAVTGSSLTTALTMGTVAWPEMEQRDYDRRLALGTLAAGGTLGILIPPSIAMILYGVFTETSVARLFIAGIVPGILLTLLFMVYVAGASIARKERAGRQGEPSSWRTKLGTLPALLPIVLLIGAVLASIYAGVATPTEAAAFGCLGAFLLATARLRLTRSMMTTTMIHTMRNSAMIMFTVLGGYIFAFAIESVGIARSISSWVGGLDVNFAVFMMVVTVVYILLGAIMDSISIIVSTIPVMFPVAMAAGADPIWFGIYMVVLIELGQITPPMGMVCFALQGVTKQPLGQIFRGVAPFFAVFLVFIAAIVVFPDIVLWLPSRL